MKLKYKVLDERAKAPRRAHPRDAGLDFAVLESVSLHPGAVAKLRTGIAVELPAYYDGLSTFDGMMKPRSGMFARGLLVNGDIDVDYRGEVHIMVANIGVYTQALVAGEYIAQMVICSCIAPELERVEELSVTERQDKGFGSTDAM